VHLTFENDAPLLLIHAGNADAAKPAAASATLRKARAARRHSSSTVLGEETADCFVPAVAPVSVVQQVAPPERAPLLLPEDEAEVERLFQKLKSAGRLDTPSLPQ